jgi:hypothetical protein
MDLSLSRLCTRIPLITVRTVTNIMAVMALAKRTIAITMILPIVVFMMITITSALEGVG